MNRNTTSLAASVLVSCALVCATFYLGADWLGIVVWGLPVGAWLLFSAAVLAFTFTGSSRSENDDEVTTGDAPSVLNSGFAPHTIGWFADRFVGLWRSLSADPETFETRLERWHDCSRWPRRPLAIGLDVEPTLAEQLIDAPGFGDIEWFHAPKAVRTGHRLDAVLRQTPDGPVRIVTQEADQRKAAWIDWAMARDLSYMTVFPGRVDPKRVTLDEPDLLQATECDLARAVLECAALLARSPARLNLSDRFRGRRPTCRPIHRPDRFSRFQAHPGLVEHALARLADMIEDRSRTDEPSTTLMAASQVTSAWLATWDGTISIPFRRKGIEAAARVLPDSPEVLLRLAAVRFADLDDNAGFEALLEADQILRRTPDLPNVEHLPLLEHEIQHPDEGPMMLGRIAAGICLACASIPRERIAYVREDVMDDVRFSKWLVGRDPDRQLLMQVFRVLEDVHADMQQAA